MTEPASPRPLTQGNIRPTLDFYLGLAAAGLTWIAAAYRVGPISRWDSDYRVVQCLSGQSLGWDGIVSVALSRALLLLPLGTPVTRLALTSALASAMVCWLLYRLCRRHLVGFAGDGPGRGWLSFGSALLFGVAPTTAVAAASPPGPLLGLAGLLAVIELSSCRRGFLLGLLVAITLLEQFWIGLFALLVLVVWCLRAHRVNPAATRTAFLGLAVTLLSVGAPWFVTRRTVLSQTLAAGRPDPTTLPRFTDPSLESLAWLFQDLGLLLLLLAVIGFWALVRRGQHRGWLSLLAMTLPGLVLEFDSEARSTLKLLTLIALLVFSSIGLEQLVELAGMGRKSPLALAATLAVVTQLTLCLAHADETLVLVERYSGFGTEVLTDEVLASTKPRSVLLLRNPLLVRRLLAARFADGLRPDLLVVPLEVATQKAVVAELLRREPALASTLRELAVNGRPSEFALSTLADERPVFLEFDPSWDRRLREHLLPLPFLHRLHSQTLGRSDRAQVVERTLGPVTRIAAATAAAAGGAPLEVEPLSNRTTLALLASRLEEQLTLLLALGDRQAFEPLFAQYERLYPRSSWAAKLRPRLVPGRHSLDAFDLVAIPAEGTVN